MRTTNKQPLNFRIKEAVKGVLKSVRCPSFIYEPIRMKWRRYRRARAIREMDAHGYETMALLHGIFMKYEIPYYCDAGTLLGFIRDGAFIKGDADFDLSIIPESVSLNKVLKCLLAEGFRFMSAQDYNGRMIEFTVMHPKLSLNIDVFQSEYATLDKEWMIVRYLRWYNDVKYPSARDNTTLEFRFRAPKGLKTMEVHGVTVSVPVNAEELLDDEYGVWRVYDPTFKSDNLPHEVGKYYAHRLTLEEAIAHK